jgi:hypothetical protein
MTSLSKSLAPSARIATGAFFLALTAVAIAAATVIVFETIKLHRFHPAVSATTAVTFGLMLTSLSGAVLSVILPPRSGRIVLLASAVMFFVALALALIYGIRD